jgi:hypothetical protein
VGGMLHATARTATTDGQFQPAAERFWLHLQGRSGLPPARTRDQSGSDGALRTARDRPRAVPPVRSSRLTTSQVLRQLRIYLARTTEGSGFSRRRSAGGATRTWSWRRSRPNHVCNRPSSSCSRAYGRSTKPAENVPSRVLIHLSEPEPPQLVDRPARARNSRPALLWLTPESCAGMFPSGIRVVLGSG